jgi:GTP-binding protein YchF
MKIVLLGFPQAGKKSLFSLLTGRSVPSGLKETESLDGNASVRDSRVDAIAAIVKPQKIKYAETSFSYCSDIREGDTKRGWMESARRSDMLCMVVRAFSSTSVYHEKGSIDPERDRSSLQTELLLADFELVEKRLERIGKEKRGGQTPVQIMEEKTLVKCKETLESDTMLLNLTLGEQELSSVRGLGLLTMKPIIWTYNVDEDAVKEEATNPVTVSCKIEQEIMGIDNVEERNAYLKELGLSSSGIDRMNRAAYDALGLMSFYTMGKDEVRAWSIRKGSTAPQAAGKIHSDIERGFIRVEVVKYDDLMAAGSEAAVKERGKVETKGKDYVIQDGDICTYLFNV